MPINRPPPPTHQHLNSTTMEQEAHNSIDIDKLFKTAMLGDWCTVVKAYTCSSGKIIDNYKAAGAKHDTALHVAVVAADDETEHVSEIIGGIPKEHLSEMLRMRNHRGNTPLHLAAAMGSVEMCWRIASEDKSLMAETNDEGETPLFLAAHRGHEKAFFYLENNFDKEDISPDMLMNSNRNTILHSAIYGQHYGFAIRIVESYPALVNYVNEENLTPLHLLALQPRSFKSSIVNLGLFDLIFYHCIIIRRHTWEDRMDKKDIEEIVRRRDSREYPQNYETCCDIYNIFKRMFFGIFGRGCSCAGGRTSLEGGMQMEDQTRKKKEVDEDGLSTTIFDLILGILKFIAFVPLHFLVSERLLSIAKRKRKHKLAERLLNELLDKTRSCKVANEKAPSTSSTSETTSDAPSRGKDGTIAGTVTSTPGKKQVQEQQQQQKQGRKFKRRKLEQSNEPFIRGETPLLTAVKLGIVEMVDAILSKFPEAIQDKDCQGKNAVLLAAENRQSRVYRLLENKKMVRESIFGQVDAYGNSALHLASRYNPNRPWFTPGPALQMKWEITWYQYVKSSMPSNFFALRNKDRKTAQEIFTESHKRLRKEGKDWLTTTCTAYCVISTLIAAVAFATSSNIPGGYDDGIPELESEFAFSVFSISSIVALCTSMSALVFFIAILTTRYEQQDFAVRIPNRLQFGLTFLFASIASMLVSFSSGFYFSVRSKLEHAAYPIFAAMCLPVTLFAAAQLPLYLGLNRVIFFNPKSKTRHFDHDIDTH